jgi:uncharacterized protein (DUF362 family)
MTTKEIVKKNLTSNSPYGFLTGISPDDSKIEKIKAIQQATEASTDFSWLSPDDSVFIKPVVNSGKPYPATTDPIAITAIIRLLRKEGAGRIVVGDLSGIGDVQFHQDQMEGKTRKLMEQTGIAQTTVKEGGEIYCFEEAGWGAFYPEKPLQGTSWKEPLMIPLILKEMDHIILLPRCGRHMMAGSTLGMKAAVGYFRTDTRMELHRDAETFYEKIAEANTIPTLLKKQRLILTIADKILTTFGPNEGYVAQPKTGLTISSSSILAHDMVSLAWLLENRKYTPEEELMDYKEVNKRYVNICNKNTVLMLSRKRTTALRSQKLVKEGLETIWDDRILKQAFTIFNGVPNVVLKPTNNLIPDELLQTLQKAVSIP